MGRGQHKMRAEWVNVEARRGDQGCGPPAQITESRVAGFGLSLHRNQVHLLKASVSKYGHIVRY